MNNFTKLQCLFSLTFFTLATFAQTSPIEFDRTFGGSQAESLRKIIALEDGGFLLGGYSRSNISGDKTEDNYGGFSDYWVIKTNSDGEKIWDKTYGGSSTDNLKDILPTPDGGYILAGSSNSPVSGNKTVGSELTDFWIIKIDSMGDIIWQSTYDRDGISNEYLVDIVASSNGGYFLGGNNDSDFWIVKIDDDGGVIWERSYGGDGFDSLQEIIETGNGDLILAGDSTSGISGDKSQENYNGSYDYWILRTTSTGDKIWDLTLGTDFSDEWLFSAIETLDGGCIVGGRSESNIEGDKTEASNGLYDFWVIKLSADGNKIWDKSIGGESDEILGDIILLDDGSYLLFGDSISNASGDKSENSVQGDYWLVNINSQGDVLWDYTIGGSNREFGIDMARIDNNNIVLAGTSYSGISGDKTQESRGDADFWFVKLNLQTLSLPDISDHQIAIWPNPSAYDFNVNFDRNQGIYTHIEIFDIHGKLLESLPLENSQLNFGKHLSPGYYFATLRGPNKMSNYKLIKQ